MSNLTAILLDSDPDFNTQYRALTIRQGQFFSVGIKEYEEEKKVITDQINTLNGEISKIDTDLVTEENRLRSEAVDRYNEGGKWKVAKKYNGKDISQAELTMHANIDDAKAAAKKKKDVKNNKLSSLNSQLSEIEKRYESVVWAWSLAYNRSSKPEGSNPNLGKGNKRLSLTLGKHIEGGGFAWVEPFLDGGKPTGSIKNGFFIHTSSEEADIITAEWYSIDQNENPKKITEPVAPASKLQLHIYTKSMYGHNIGVEMKANGKTLKANTYGRNFIITASTKTKATSFEDKYEIQESEDRFLTEVEVYDYSDPKSIQPPAGAITGHLVGDKEDQSGEANLPNVQKAVLDFYADPSWSFGVPKIIVTPTIHFGGKMKTLDAKLEINGHQSPEIEIPEHGNMPAFVDKVETNFEEFHHCRYDKVLAKYEEDGTQKNITIFDSNKQDLSKKNLVFPFVVGCDEAKREFEITVDKATTTECSFDKTDSDHQNQVIDTSKIEDRIAKGEGENKSEWRLGQSDQIFSGGKKKTERSDDENDDSNITTSHVTNKFTFKNGISKISGQKSFRILEKKTSFEFSKVPDQQVKMKIGYDYTFGGTVLPLTGLCYTFWPYRDATAQNYSMSLNTCAYNKNLDIQIYPDTKWTVQLGFNYDKEKFNQMRTIYHEKWKLQGLEAEEEKRRLQAKIDGTEENIEKLSKEKKNAKKNDKGEIQGKIDKQNRKRTNFENRSSEQQRISDKSISKNSKGGKLSKAFDLMEPDDALEHGLIDCELGIIAEFDRPFGALDLTSGYSEIIDFIRKIADIKLKIDNIIHGKDAQNTQNTPKENPDRTKNLKNKLNEKKTKGSKKSNWNFEFIPPSIGLSVGWYAEHPKDLEQPIVGTMIEGIIDLDPLFGFEATYDVYQLLYNIKHPAVLAVVATLDILDELLEDNFDINLDLIITTEANGTLKGIVNTADGSNFTERLMKDEDDTPAKFSGSIKVKLQGFVQANTTIETFLFGSYSVGGEVQASLEAGISIEFVTKANENMLFLEPEIKVDSFVLKGSVKGHIVKKKRGTNPKDEVGIEGSSNGEIILTDAYEWEVNNWRVPLIKFN